MAHRTQGSKDFQCGFLESSTVYLKLNVHKVGIMGPPPKGTYYSYQLGGL